jgi:hypothetical protein
MASTGATLLLGAGVVAALLLARNHAQLEEEMGVLRQREQAALIGRLAGAAGGGGVRPAGYVPHGHQGRAGGGGARFYLRVEGHKPQRLYDVMQRRDRLSIGDLAQMMVAPDVSGVGAAGESAAAVWGLKAASYDMASGHVWATMDVDASKIALEPAAGWTTWLLVSK